MRKTNQDHFIINHKFILTFLLTLFIFLNDGFTQDEQFKKVDISDIILNVYNSSQSLEDWTNSLNTTDYRLLCLGEIHEDFYRDFYGELLNKIEFKSLGLETHEENYQELLKDYKNTGSAKYLNANFAPIMKAIELKNDINVYSVEQTKAQDILAYQAFVKTSKNNLYRDGFIASNILQKIKSQEKMVLIYGKNHCSTNNLGLGTTPFMNLLKSQLGVDKALSVTVLKREGSQTHPLISYLDAHVEVKKKAYVIKSQDLKAEMHNFNWEIMTLTQNYDFIIVH